MKLTDHFDDFLRDTVNLNETRLDTLKSRVNAIENFLKANEIFGSAFEKLEPQGSWALRTIIKPSEKNPEFDADVLLYLKEFKKWEPADYVEKLYAEFRKSGIYQDKVSRNTRCVVVDYAGDFHVDVVPVFVRDDGGPPFWASHTYITNRISNSLEETNPEGYTAWFNDQNRKANGKLIKVVRLAKYLRDIKKTFSVKSILLTTLLANQVKIGWWYGDFAQKEYPDVPTTIKQIFNGLNEYLEKNKTIPHIHNPSLKGEDFIRHWDEKKYANFRDKVAFYTSKINAAYDESDRDASVLKWREVFGDSFAGSVAITKSAFVATDVLASIKSLSYSPSRFDVPHRQALRWIMAPQTGWVKVSCWQSGDGFRTSQVYRNSTILSKSLSLRFEAKANVLPPYDVFWQVVNTGPQAQAANALRGDFYNSSAIENGIHIRRESTLYSGTHWVEAFVVQNGRCVARSGEFVVNIQ